MSIKETIEDEYNKIETNMCSTKSQVLYNLISIKINCNLRNYFHPLYVDAKNYIHYLFKEEEFNDYGYDTLQEDKITEIIQKFPIPEQRALCIFTKHKASEYGLELSKIDNLFYNVSLSELRDNKNWLQYLSLLLGKNIWIMLLCYLLFVIIITLMLLPAPFEFMEILDVTLCPISNNNIANYLSNALIWLFGIEQENIRIVPIGFIGTLIYCLGRIFSILFIGNYLFQKICSYISSLTYNAY